MLVGLSFLFVRFKVDIIRRAWIPHVKSTLYVKVYPVNVKRILSEIKTIYAIAYTLLDHFQAIVWKLATDVLIFLMNVYDTYLPCKEEDWN